MEERPLTPRSDDCRCNNKNQDPLLFKKYFTKYRTVKKLGEGSFGKVYKAEYKGEYYAAKFEERNKGKTSGSRVCFYRESDKRIIMLHNPHPGNIMKRGAIKQLAEQLKDWGEI